MGNILGNLIIFVLSYILVLIVYEIFIVNKAKKNRYDKNKKKPIEVRFLINKYGIDIDKIDYNQMLQIIALVSSFDIALIAAVLSVFDSSIIQLVVGIVVILPVIFISYSLIGRKYRKKMKKK